MATTFLPKVRRAQGFVSFLFKEEDAAALRDAILHARVRFPVVVRLRKQLELSPAELARILGVSEKTIRRKERDAAPLDPGEADRVYRFAKVLDHAVAAFGDRELALRWFRTPNTYLGNITPLEMVDTEVGVELVEQSLGAVEFGGLG